MQLDADHCLAFEDSGNGIKSSRGASLCTIVTINDYTADHDFSEAAVVLDNMGEPGQACKVIAGDIDTDYLNVDALYELHRHCFS